MGHFAVSDIESSSVTLKTWRKEQKNTVMFYQTIDAKTNVAFTPTSIPPRFESWALSCAGRGGPISSFQILSCLDVNLDNRVDRGKIFGCQKFSPD